MSFKEQVEADVTQVFLNLGEFGELRNFQYSGRTMTDVPVVITHYREEGRERLTSNLKESGGRSSYSDHLRGLYASKLVLHLPADFNNGRIPENGQKIRVSRKQGGTFYDEYRIMESYSDMGKFRLVVQAVDE